MSALKQVLAAFQETAQPLSLNQIAQQLNIEPALVEDMIAFWVRKGKLRDTSVADSCSTGNCHSCSTGGCPFVVQTPKRYELVSQKRPNNGWINLQDIG